MPTLRWSSITAITLAVLLASAPADAQAPIKIGASLSLTGSYAKPGTYQKEGYEVCADELNAKGGLLGRKVEFVMYDDQSSTQTAQRLYEKLITEDKVDAVMGPYSSGITESVAGISEKYKKVLVSPLAATTSIFRQGRKYIFMVISPAEVYLEGLVDMAARPSRWSTRTPCSPRPPPRARWRWRRRRACRWCSRNPIPRAIPISQRSS